MAGEREILAIDIGGSHVKLRASTGGGEQRAKTPDGMGPGEMVQIVRELADGLSHDVITMGYPGPVVHGHILGDPPNLGPGWVGYGFEAAFAKPLRICNDAMMQAIGSYEGGRMLFLGLGTGLGAAMIVAGVCQPMELAHLPYRKGHRYEHYLGEASLEKRGRKKWQARVFDAVEKLTAALQPDYVVLGGGNADRLKALPEKCRLGNNDKAFDGGFRLWRDTDLIV